MKNSNLIFNSLITSIEKIAGDHGLVFWGVASLDLSRDAQRYQTWLTEGRHGGMAWMEKHLDIRANPDMLLEGAKSALVFGFPYYLGDRWVRGVEETNPRIAQYARLRDYHKFMRTKLTQVAEKLKISLGQNHAFRITIDSAPLLERALAGKTGKLFIGKNTCAIDPIRGSFFLLGEIITTWNNGDLVTDIESIHQPRTAEGGCGTCRRCQVHCPTGALDKDYQIDARKCLSYWTIEHKGEIPTEYWPWVARYMFGCDICQLVCPYNRRQTSNSDAQTMVKIEQIELFDMVVMDHSFYESHFGGTPMTRAKRSGLRRNALIAAVVRRDRRVIEILESLTNDSDPIIVSTVKTAKSFLENDKKRE